MDLGAETAAVAEAEVVGDDDEEVGAFCFLGHGVGLVDEEGRFETKVFFFQFLLQSTFNGRESPLSLFAPRFDARLSRRASPGSRHSDGVWATFEHREMKHSKSFENNLSVFSK